MAKKSRTQEEEKQEKSESEDLLNENTVLKKTKASYIETNLDRFYNMIKERQTMSFDKAASEFGVDRNQIASWAKILEEHKLASVHYPLFGVPSIFFREKQKKEFIKGEERVKRPGKMAPKILVVLAGGLMVLLGYVMTVSNTFTITVRLQIAAIAGRITGILMLPYPLNIIAPIGILIAAVWAAAGLRRKKKSGRKPRDLGSKLSKIKKELESK